jgi:glucan phosphoethanolaminetransferase (alkaline phosphatase superfamily)
VHSQEQRASSARSLFLFLFVEALVGAASLNYFCRTFAISRALLAVHLPLVVLVWAAMLVAPAFALALTPFGRRPWARWALAVPAALAFSLLWLLYAADFASNLWMGSNVTYKLVALWVSDWWQGGNLLMLSRWVYVGAGAAAVGVLALQLFLAKRAIDRFATARVRPIAVAIGAVLFVVVAGVAARELPWRTPRSELLTSDPLLGFLRRTVDVYDDRYLALTATLRESEPRARAAYPRPAAFSRRNVIVVIVDSLRADHMGLYGYHRPTTPFLSELHQSGRLRKVELATSMCAESNCGILATLFSKPLRYQIPEDFKLYDLLGDQGYRTYFVLSGSHNWQGLRESYGNEMTRYFDGRNSTRFAWSDDRVLFEGLDQLPDAGSPAFFYFHLMSPHLIGVKQDKYRAFQPSDVKNDWDALFSGRYDPEAVVNNYDNGVLQADGTIRDLFAALDRKGYLRGSLVMILADHGEGLGDRGEGQYGHVSRLYQEFIRIPLLIYDEEPAEYANLQFATQLDVAPTIVERLGLPVPGSWQGRSLLDPTIRTESEHQTTLKAPCYAVIRREAPKLYKYMRCFVGRSEELYDLAVDPGERINIIDRVDASVADGFRARAEEIRSR